MNKKIVRSCNFSQVGMRYKYENFFINNLGFSILIESYNSPKKIQKYKKGIKSLKTSKDDKINRRRDKKQKMIYKTKIVL